MKNHVIHARLDDQSFAQIEALKHLLGFQKTTEVISFALHELFDKSQDVTAKKSSFELMKDAGLIGCIRDAAISSSRASYKNTAFEHVTSKLETQRNE